MDKSTYLKQLETALREKYAEPQVKDILSDYEDFFASGAEAGKSEAELCAEFGPPEQAAAELKSESEVETPRRGLMPFAIACSVLAIAFIAVFWVFRNVFLAPHMQLPNAVGFWLALLFPLSLEGVLAVWFSRNSSPKGGMKWIPTVQAVLAVPVIATLVWLIHYARSAPSIYGNLQNAGTLVASVTGTLTNAAYLILLASIVLFLFYATHGHRRAHWFLFLDTTLLALTLNFVSLLSQINPETYDASEGIARCFLWAVLPNLAAAGIAWAIRKIVSVRRAKAWTDR